MYANLRIMYLPVSMWRLNRKVSHVDRHNNLAKRKRGATRICPTYIWLVVTVAKGNS